MPNLGPNQLYQPKTDVWPNIISNVMLYIPRAHCIYDRRSFSIGSWTSGVSTYAGPRTQRPQGGVKVPHWVLKKGKGRSKKGAISQSKGELKPLVAVHAYNAEHRWLVY
jgi:hypothetical protein